MDIGSLVAFRVSFPQNIANAFSIICLMIQIQGSINVLVEIDTDDRNEKG
jgi:hypothetical protein